MGGSAEDTLFPGGAIGSGMRKVEVADVDRVPSPASVRRPLADAMGAEHVAVNYYELEPGESFAFGYHRHEGQEEVFYVIAGTATFETAEGEMEVGPDEALHVAPGEFQQGFNRGDERVVALALGAPKRATGGEMRRDCPDCGERTRHRFESEDEGRTRLTICLECGAETGRYTV